MPNRVQTLRSSVPGNMPQAATRAPGELWLNFADAHIGTLDEPSLDDFERLIEVPNSDLYAWVSGEAEIPANYDTTVLRQLKDFHARAKEER